MWVIGNEMRGYHVFLCPIFGILVSTSYLKRWFNACERARGLTVDTAWLVQGGGGVDGEDFFFFLIVFGLFFRPL